MPVGVLADTAKQGFAKAVCGPRQWRLVFSFTSEQCLGSGRAGGLTGRVYLPYTQGLKDTQTQVVESSSFSSVIICCFILTY